MVFAGAACEVGARLLYPAPPYMREPQLLYRARPDVGFHHVPNQKGYLEDGLATINGFGFRGPMPRLPKPDGWARVLAVGDSTTFGLGVDDEGAYPAQLERRLRERATESSGEIEDRIRVARWQLEQAYRFRYMVRNDERARATEGLIAIVERELELAAATMRNP